MVIESAAVIAEGATQGLVDAVQGGKDVLDGLSSDTGLLGSGVEGVGVGGVVFGVVGLHRQRVDVGLKGVIGIGKLDLLEHGELLTCGFLPAWPLL